MSVIPWDFGFWHPFGPHGGECPRCIIRRKQHEIDQTGGWTFWSFQHRTTIAAWRTEIGGAARVIVFCSDSPGARDPAGMVRPMAEYLNAAGEWEPIPPTISIPHPTGQRIFASAFKVRAIHSGSQAVLGDTMVEWLATGKDKGWRQSPLPTRGEYLLRPGAGTPVRKVAAVLELAEPYAVSLRGVRTSV